MRAVLLFSAVLHIGALGMLMAYALRGWLETRRPKEPSFTEMASVAGSLGLAVAAATTLLLELARPFGTALAAGLGAGLIAAIAFLLTSGAWPHRPAHGGPMSYAGQVTITAFVGLLVVTELVAFAFLIAAAGTVAPHS